MPMIEANGVNVYYELHGATGEPIVLIHGSWTDHNTWNLVVPELADNFRLLTYDRRGHGKSENGAGQGTAEQDALDTANILTNLELAPAHVVGSSFGGTIALKLASLKPATIQSLVVHEPPLHDLIMDEPSIRPSLLEGRKSLDRVAQLVQEGDKEGAARLFTEALTLGPGSWERLPIQVRDTMVANADTWLDENNDLAGRSVDLKALARFDKPTLLMYGGRGLQSSKLIIDKLQRNISNSTVDFDPNAGHTPQFSNPTGFARTVSGFVHSVTLPAETPTN